MTTMKLLILSDSHGILANMERAVDEAAPQMILHLGDCWQDGVRLHSRFPEIPFRQVPGNCDFRPDEPAELLLGVGGLRLLMCHGQDHLMTAMVVIDLAEKFIEVYQKMAG